MLSDWVKIVILVGTSNQNALFLYGTVICKWKRARESAKMKNSIS